MAKTPLPLKIDEGLMKWIREEASKENRSINNFIETKLYQVKTLSDAITDFVNQPKEEKPTISKWAQKLEEMQKAQAEKLKESKNNKS